MIIQNVRLKNFGPFRNEIDFDLSVEKGKNIILVGGLNGSGKTSLLNGIRLALFGKLIGRSLDNTENYENILNQYLNQQQTDGDSSYVEIVFKQNFSDRSLYHIKRSWIKNNGSYKEDFIYKKVSIEENNNYIEEDLVIEGLNWYGVLETLFPPQVAKLFLFDGEKIEAMADPINTGKMLASSIDVLFGGGILTQLEQDLKYIKRDLIKEQAQYSEDRSFINEVEKYSDLENQINILKKQRIEIENNIELIKENTKLSQEELRSIGGDYRQKHSIYEERIEELEKKMVLLNQDMIALMNQELPYTLLSRWIEDMYESGKSSIYNQDILAVENLIAERDSKIIDSLSDSGIDDRLIQNLKKFMHNSRADIINTRTTQFSHQEQAEAKLYISRKAETEASFKSIINQFNKLEDELNLNKDLLSMLPPVEKAEPILKTIENYNLELSEATMRVKMIDEHIFELEISKEQKQKNIHKQMERISNARIGNAEIHRMQKRITQIEELIHIFKTRLCEKKLQRIEQLTLESFNTIYRKTGFIRRLVISPTELTFNMEDKFGNEVSLSRLSAGERQILVTSLLWAIAKTSKNSLPFIIDTPLGRLDSEHRSNLIENFYPTASHQVILLSTDQEIVGDSYNKLQPYIAKEYGIIYDTHYQTSSIIKSYPFKVGYND